MRQTRTPQLALGEARIEDIKLDHKSRDDIPAVLLGLQHLYSHEETREKLFSLLEEHILPGTNRNVGRPGMELWRILVMGVLKQGLGCDFDRLHELVNQHRTVREFLGHGAFSQDDTYELQTIIDNVYLLTPELLSEIGQLVVESGHAVARKKPGEPLRGRCDSFVVETDVHYPTDVNLLWDAMRCLLRELGRAARKHNVGGWRQWRHLTQEVKKCFNKVRSTRRAKSQPDRVEAYIERCGHLVDRAEESLKELEQAGVAQSSMIQSLIAHARRQIDQVERRLLKGETIAHDEKVFSIFEEHTRWVSKGKAGCAVELGVPVCVVEDQFQFFLHHKILWEGSDTDIAVSIIERDAGTASRPTGVQLRPWVPQPREPRRSSTQCSTSMRCRARVGFQWPSASASKRKHLPRPSARCARCAAAPPPQSTSDTVAAAPPRSVSASHRRRSPRRARPPPLHCRVPARSTVASRTVVSLVLTAACLPSRRQRL